MLTDAIADIAMALVLMVTRRLGEGERLVRDGVPWRWGMDFMLGRALEGRTLGIVGVGEIGQATARRARAFGMSIAYAGRKDAESRVLAELDARRFELADLLEVSDVVSLHVPYSPLSHHLIGANELRLLGSEGYLVNSGRG